MGGCCALILFIRHSGSVQLGRPIVVSNIVGVVFLMGFYIGTQFRGLVGSSLFCWGFWLFLGPTS